MLRYLIYQRFLDLCSGGNLRLVHQLLEDYPTKWTVTELHTALKKACESGNVKVGKWLIDEIPAFEDYQRMLRICWKTKQLELVEWILSSKDVDYSTVNDFIYYILLNYDIDYQKSSYLVQLVEKYLLTEEGKLRSNWDQFSPESLIIYGLLISRADILDSIEVEFPGEIIKFVETNSFTKIITIENTCLILERYFNEELNHKKNRLIKLLFRTAVTTGNISLTEWLFNKLSDQLPSLRVSLNYAFESNLECVKLVCAKYKTIYQAKDKLYDYRVLLNVGIGKIFRFLKNPDILIWLYTNFSGYSSVYSEPNWVRFPDSMKLKHIHRKNQVEVLECLQKINKKRLSSELISVLSKSHDLYPPNLEMMKNICRFASIKKDAYYRNSIRVNLEFCHFSVCQQLIQEGLAQLDSLSIKCSTISREFGYANKFKKFESLIYLINHSDGDIREALSAYKKRWLSIRIPPQNIDNTTNFLRIRNYIASCRGEIDLTHVLSYAIKNRHSGVVLLIVEESLLPDCLIDNVIDYALETEYKKIMPILLINYPEIDIFTKKFFGRRHYPSVADAIRREADKRGYPTISYQDIDEDYQPPNGVTFPDYLLATTYPEKIDGMTIDEENNYQYYLENSPEVRDELKVKYLIRKKRAC